MAAADVKPMETGPDMKSIKKPGSKINYISTGEGLMIWLWSQVVILLFLGYRGLETSFSHVLFIPSKLIVHLNRVSLTYMTIIAVERTARPDLSVAFYDSTLISPTNSFN